MELYDAGRLSRSVSVEPGFREPGMPNSRICRLTGRAVLVLLEDTYDVLGHR